MIKTFIILTSEHANHTSWNGDMRILIVQPLVIKWCKTAGSKFTGRSRANHAHLGVCLNAWQKKCTSQMRKVRNSACTWQA